MVAIALVAPVLRDNFRWAKDWGTADPRQKALGTTALGWEPHREAGLDHGAGHRQAVPIHHQ